MIEIAKVTKPHGIRGHIKIIVFADSLDIFKNFEYVFIDGNKVYIEDLKFLNDSIALKLKDIDSINEAEKLRNKFLTVTREMLPGLPDGVFYIADLIGLEVKTDKGVLIGHIKDVFSTPNNDVYVVKTSRGELLIPVIEDVVISKSLDSGILIKDLREWQ